MAPQFFLLLTHGENYREAVSMEMSEKLKCPYLNQNVEFSEDRKKHITETHPDLLPEYQNCIIEVLRDPDEIRKSKRFGNALMFSRWFEDVKNGKYVVVVVITEESPSRSWVVTAYMSKKLIEGDVTWKKS